MSLTGKLILGFLFALVLQVVQMAISGYFTASMQETTDAVSDALAANIAVQRSLDVVHQLQGQVTGEVERATPLNRDVCAVFVDELQSQADLLAEAAAAHAPAQTHEVATAIAEVADQLAAVRALAPRAPGRGDAVAFLDDALAIAAESLQHTQVVIGNIGLEGVEREHAMRDVPMQAGVAITLGGIVIMAAFVAWFSRQLVIPIERAWAQLESRVDERTAELASTVGALESEIQERKKAERQREELHQKLVDASRRAGMAELANGVLHNVGNVLNSVNVSANLLLRNLQQSRVPGLSRAAGLLRAHEHELLTFLQESPQGQKLPSYLEQLGEHLLGERDALLAETRDLTSYVDHMKDIVHRQQSYACVSGTTSLVRLGELIDDVLRMHTTSFARHNIELVRDMRWDDACELDRSRVLQILMNLINNARQAITGAGVEAGRITITVTRADDGPVLVCVADNGPGIAAEDLARIFAHGFTTKQDGHGFGLHHSANSATEMGGRLWAESDGIGRGASFLLELPVKASAAEPRPPEVVA